MPKKIFFIIAIGLIAAGVTAAYFNKQEAERQVARIVAADQKGEDTVSTLSILKIYTGSHMFSGQTVVLKAGFERSQKAFTEATAAANASAQIYVAAQKACAGKSDSIVQAKCNAQYLSEHLSNVPVTATVPEPKLEAYTYKYVSPIWTPDFAGVLLLAGGLFGIWWGTLMFGSNKRKR
jgi:hypothetical protein